MLFGKKEEEKLLKDKRNTTMFRCSLVNHQRSRYFIHTLVLFRRLCRLLWKEGWFGFPAWLAFFSLFVVAPLPPSSLSSFARKQIKKLFRTRLFVIVVVDLRCSSAIIVIAYLYILAQKRYNMYRYATQTHILILALNIFGHPISSIDKNSLLLSSLNKHTFVCYSICDVM